MTSRRCAGRYSARARSGVRGDGAGGAARAHLHSRTKAGAVAGTLATGRATSGHWSSALNFFSPFSMKRASFILLTAAGLGTLSVTRRASALGPVDVEVAAKVGGGTNPVNVPGGQFGPAQVNALGFGLGARAGASISGFYGGLTFMYYFGERQRPYPTDTNILIHLESFSSVMYGIEAGYNFSVSLLTIRPQLGLGNYTLTASSPGTTTSSSSNLYLEAGVEGLLSLGRWLVGADASTFLLPGWSDSHPGGNSREAFTAHGQVGVRF